MRGVSQPFFNLADHQRRRIRTLERDIRGLEQTRDDLVRVLALTVQVAAGQDCNPVLLMFLIEAYYRQQQERLAALDDDLAAGERFLALLHELTPDRTAAA